MRCIKCADFRLIQHLKVPLSEYPDNFLIGKEWAELASCCIRPVVVTFIISVSYHYQNLLCIVVLM